MDFLTLAQTARKIGVSRTELFHLRKRPDFPAPLMLTSRTVRYVADEIDAWMMARPRAAEPSRTADPARPAAGA